ncbi:MAG: Cyclic di-GMP phosphodiesterase Gmr [Pseudomonadota bacterium]
MNGNNTDLPSLPLRISPLQIIGFKDPDQGSWARLRALQYAQLHNFALTRILSHLVGVIFTGSIYMGKVPTLEFAAWAIAVVMAVWNATRVERSLADIDRRSMTRNEFRRQAIGVAGCALVWAIALVLFVPYGGRPEHYALWTLVAMLIAGSVVTMAAAPIATVLFALITGGTAVGMFLLFGEVSFALLSAVFLVGAVSGAVEAARTFLAARIAEAGVSEKDQVVSLLLREFEENEADWLWQIDINRRIRSASPRFAYALGNDPAKLQGQSFIRVISGKAWENGQFPPSLHDLAERLKRRESFSNLMVQVDVQGDRRWWELSGTPMLDEKGNFIGYRGVGSDVTERRESDEKIAYLARYDTLTGLPNRLMLTEALGEALRYAMQWKARCAFLMIDLDRFKSVNDSLGHQVGDKLLAQVSGRLKLVAGDNCHIGRLGGDEFAVVIRDASDIDYVSRVAKSVIETLSLPYDVDNHTLYIGASVGSAVGPRDGDTVEALMRNADLALYRAKDEGGGELCNYEPSLHANAEERRKLELSLRRAVGNQELKLAFQPVVDANSEEVVSFEALLRWNSKEHGFVSPAKFIPLAEDTRLIVPIGDWVLHEACRQAVRWPGKIKVAVNVSGEQLLEPGFSTSVVRALADTGLPAHRLEVEVTESIFLRDARTARTTLEELMALGCSIALDDFGTGYSSLGYLRTLRFSTIKVDRSFVTGAAQGSAESLAIIRAVVAMAQSLEMSTTAEGVESEQEVAMIRELGCDKIQGYYFGRPMEPAEAHALVDRKRRMQFA